MCIHTYRTIHIYIYIYIHIYRYTYISLSIYLSLYIHHIYIYTQREIHDLHLGPSVFAGIGRCRSTILNLRPSFSYNPCTGSNSWLCIYIYTYTINTYIHTCIHIYIYIHKHISTTLRTHVFLSLNVYI